MSATIAGVKPIERISIPKGAGMQLLLQPRAGADAITRALRSLRVRLDTMTGAVSALELEETLGDRVLLELGQQQQNLDEDVLRQLIDR